MYTDTVQSLNNIDLAWISRRNLKSQNWDLSLRFCSKFDCLNRRKLKLFDIFSRNPSLRLLDYTMYAPISVMDGRSRVVTGPVFTFGDAGK
jgi:hypothetical protein